MLGVKVLSVAFIIALLFSAVAGTFQLSAVHASTDVSGMITQDTTWTKANGPYIIREGPVIVGKGVTLTIEAGVTVIMADGYIGVNGTLIARGTSTDQIHFYSGHIAFYPLSSSWNEQAGSGCVIENAIIDVETLGMEISAKITANTIEAFIGVYGDAIISNNIITGRIHVSVGSPVISNNKITAAESNTGAIHVSSGSPIISNNQITSVEYKTTEFIGGWRSTKIIKYPGITLKESIDGDYYSADIFNNLISGCSTGIIASESGTATIESNTIFDNEYGIEISEEAIVVIRDNNIHDNENYNLYSTSPDEINAADNWWGITEESTINQTISGKVNFTPFLNTPNSEAPTATSLSPNPSLPTAPPIPTPEPTTSPSQESSLTQEPLEMIIGAAITVAVISAGLGLLIYLIKRK